MACPLSQHLRARIVRAVAEGSSIGQAAARLEVSPPSAVVFDLLTAAARDEGIPYQVSVFAAATPTDANAMQLNRGGMAVGLLGVAIRYMHTPCELLSLTDLQNCARLMAAYCRCITSETNFTP